MKLATFTHAGRTRIGLVDESDIVDLAAAGMQPPRWLKVGDVVRMEVEGIGSLENRVVPEPPGTMGFIDSIPL